MRTAFSHSGGGGLEAQRGPPEARWWGTWVSEGREAEMGDKILLKGLENLPENLPSSRPQPPPYRLFFTNFLFALFQLLDVSHTGRHMLHNNFKSSESAN